VKVPWRQIRTGSRQGLDYAAGRGTTPIAEIDVDLDRGRSARYFALGDRWGLPKGRIIEILWAREFRQDGDPDAAVTLPKSRKRRRLRPCDAENTRLIRFTRRKLGT